MINKKEKKSYYKESPYDSLDEISKLEDNWNGNGASKFSSELIDKCNCILSKLHEDPKIFPTACGSVQFEFEDENGNYLEFEIYEDKVEIFLNSTLYDDKNKCDDIDHLVVDRMNSLILYFYDYKENLNND